MSATTDTNFNSLQATLKELKGTGQGVLRERQFTSESTPEPDLDPNVASSINHGDVTAETPSPPTGQQEGVETRSKPDFIEDDSDDKPPTEEQVAAVKEVLEANSNNYIRILGLKKEKSAY
jgi:hypothetical protein